MAGYSLDNLSSMVEKVTSGATGALGKIQMSGYDSADLTSMVEKVTAGATVALGKIEMTGDAADPQHDGESDCRSNQTLGRIG